VDALVIAVAGGVGAVVGALVTALVTLVAGWLSRRHDQRRWLLDKRLESYATFNGAMSRLSDSYGVEAEENRAMSGLIDATAHIALVAPVGTADLTTVVTRAAFDELRARRSGNGLGVAEECYSKVRERLLIQQRQDLQGDALPGRFSLRRPRETRPTGGAR
jgi:hypothetical protein